MTAKSSLPTQAIAGSFHKLVDAVLDTTMELIPDRQLAMAVLSAAQDELNAIWRADYIAHIYDIRRKHAAEPKTE